MILLSFNITDSVHFLKNKLQISDENLIKIIEKNTESVLRTLENHEVTATFFISDSLVSKFEKLIKLIYKERHEIAIFQQSDYIEKNQLAKEKVFEYIGKSAKGIRNIGGGISLDSIDQLGFSYYSPIEKMKLTYLLKRLERKTEVYSEKGIQIIPESISPYTQIPYNETIFQYVPLKYYQNMVLETLKNEDYVLVYLNMLQFTDFEDNNLKIPFYKKYNTGKKLEDKLNSFLSFVNENDLATSLMKDYLL